MPLLVLDVHYLAHRAFHTTKGLEWQGRATGVVFGFLKSIASLKDAFQTDRICFCFEHPVLFRRDVYPPYKLKRHSRVRTEEEAQSYTELAVQISELRQRYLPSIGFKNIFRFHGMESDDIMAAIASNMEEDVILVTADADLLQCLRPTVSIFNPQKNKLLTEAWFKKEYGIRPPQWAVVKAMAGCGSDEVEGIKGIGEKTALKYLTGELSTESHAGKQIVSQEGKAIIRRNRPLVQLPYLGCPVPHLQEDQVTREAWTTVCTQLGFKSLAGRPPVASRRLTNL